MDLEGYRQTGKTRQLMGTISSARNVMAKQTSPAVITETMDISLFEVVGPIMMGPSSSATAGMARSVLPFILSD